MRIFETGATRDDTQRKYDYEGFLSPLVLERYAEYMNFKRVQPDGQLRDGDNWQLGIPLKSYMQSAWRHFILWWKIYRGYHSKDLLEETLCALIFNTSGYLHEILKEECNGS